MNLDCDEQAVLNAVEWRHHDLSKSSVVVKAPPAHGHAYAWLMPTESRLASASNVGHWLTAAERKRVRNHPQVSIGRRFGIARATLRLVLSQMFACAPSDIELVERPGERIAVACGDFGMVGVDIAYSGIWIVMVATACKVGVGLTVMPNEGTPASGEAPCGDAFRISGERIGQDVPQPRYSLVLPMLGGLCSVATTEHRIETVDAFGFIRPTQRGW